MPVIPSFLTSLWKGRGRKFAALLVGIWTLVAGARAEAAPKDDKVHKMDQDAIENDYLEMDFPEAVRKLKQAIAICGRTGCARTVVAQVHFDLGVVYVGWKKPEDAKAQFAYACQFDPDIAIPKALSTPDVKEAFIAGRDQAKHDPKPADPPPRPSPPTGQGSKAKANADSNIHENNVGRICGMDSDCFGGSCREGRCSEEPPGSARKTCESDSQCGTGGVCKSGSCETKYKKNWFSLVWQEDLVILPAARDVCLNQTAYACIQGNGSYYAPNQPQTLQGESDQLKTSPAFGTYRVLIGYDRVVSEHFTLGGRIGYAFGAGPASRSGADLIPFHVEARTSLWLGSDPFSRTGIRPYLVASVGFGQVDGSVQVDVAETMMTGKLTALQRSGALFAGGGFGLVYALHRNTGFFFEARGQRMFPNVGTVIPLQLGYVLGL